MHEMEQFDCSLNVAARWGQHALPSRFFIGQHPFDIASHKELKRVRRSLLRNAVEVLSSAQKQVFADHHR